MVIEQLSGDQEQESERLRKHLHRILAAFQNQGWEAEVVSEGNWIRVEQASVLSPGERLTAFLKVFADPSKYGLQDGRISKLNILSHGRLLYNYDRGLDFNDLARAPHAEAFFYAILAIAN